MRRFLSLFTMLMLCGVLAFAQSRVVSGKVTDADGNPVPFATVKIKGSNTGLSADANGAYSIKVKTGDVLVISGASYKTIEVPVGSQTVLNTVIEKGSTAELKEVVVTGGYGVKRSQKTSTTNTQVVTAEKLNTIRNTNINEALAGKVAGIQLRGQSGAKLGSSGNGSVLLHGANSLFGSSGLLYILDGNRVNSDDINTDDVEDVSLLSGPAAAAIFGPDASGGAIVVTSKKAKRTSSNSGIGIDVNLGIRFDNVYILPNYQNTYAGGDFSELKKYNWKPGQPVEWKALDGKYYPDYSEDVSWGPRMVGQEYIPWYAWYGGHENAYKTAQLTPQPNNARSFYETQQKKFNTFTFSKATDNMNLRFSYSNVDVKGLIPTTYFKRNQFTANTSADLTSHLTVGIDLNYITTQTNGDFNDSYANQSSGSFNQWFHRDLDLGIIKDLKDLKTPGGVQASWNHNNPDSYNPNNPKDFYGPYYWQNFYTSYDQVRQFAEGNKLIAAASLTYKVSKDFRIKGTYRLKNTSGLSEQKTSSDLTDMKFSSQAANGQPAFNGLPANPFIKGGYSSATGYTRDQHIELTAIYSKTVRDFNFGATVGFDGHSYNEHSNFSTTSGGFNTPNLYTIANSKDQYVSTDGRYTVKDNALFISGQAGYRRFLNVDFTLRNDWLSMLPADQNDILAKSFGASFVFSDLLKNQLPWLTLGKIRASWGEVPQSLDEPARLVRGGYRYPGSLYSQGTLQWNSNFTQGTSSSQVDPLIRGAVSTEKTIGANFEFFKSGRVGFSATYIESVNKGFPININYSLSSGTSSLLTNAGEINSKAIDLTLTLKPIFSRNFKWEINGSYSKTLSNDVVDVDGKPQSAWRDAGIIAPSITIETATFGPALRAIEGQKYGQLIGHGIKRDASGNALINNDGTYAYDNNVVFGSVLPDYTGGVQNSLTLFGDFSVNFNIDFQKGGKFYSTSTKWGNSTGVLAKTAGLNDKGIPIRDAIADGGGVHIFGVDATTLKPVDYYVNARDYFNGSNNTYDNDIFDLTYVKLREVGIGYNIPVNKLNIGKWIKRANFSIISSNTLLIYAKTKDFDPSEISAKSGEGGQFPGLRGLGLNLKIGF
jgi:TonB-linked SusC/RagA family outer membrane protein